MQLRRYHVVRVGLFGFLLASATGLTGCAKTQVSDLQSEVDRLRQQIEALQKQLEESSTRLQGLQSEIEHRGTEGQEAASEKTLVNVDAAVTSQDVQTQPASAVANARPAGVPTRPAGVKRAAAPAARPAGNGGGTTGAAAPARPATVVGTAEQERLYNEAFILYGQKSYPQAIARFGEFIARYPSSALSDNAQYWIGECYLDMDQAQAALDAFQKLLSRYPTGNKVPDGFLKSGMAYLRLNNLEKASESFKKVVESYPDSEAAHVAKENLAKMEEK